jgi:trk system potassium uptake protein TrkA
VARETFGIERVVARIYDPRRAIIYERLGIPTIATVQWTIDRVVRRLIPEAEDSDWIDPSAGVVLVEREVAASWAGRPLGEIEIPGVARAVAVARMGTAQVATPDLVTQDGDLVYLAVAIGHVSDIDAHLRGEQTSGGVHQ